MNDKELMNILKALSNETRLNILRWLKEPELHFPPQGTHLDGIDLRGTVCVSSIQEKAALSQSTISHYLDILLRADLLEAERYGKWTYYRRNQQALQAFIQYFGEL